MPLVQCRKCHTDILVLGFAAHGPKRCPICGARWVSAEPSSDRFRPSGATLEAVRPAARTPRFRSGSPQVPG
jgi:hypothetical protein